MYRYLKLVVMKLLPMSSVSDPEFRMFSKFDEVFSVKHLNSVDFKITEIVEKSIGVVMKDTQGAIVHDGWTSNEMHYFGVFASFMEQATVTRDGVESVEQEHRFPLLSVSPLTEDTDSEPLQSDHETNFFDSATHVHASKLFLNATRLTYDNGLFSQ